MAVYTRTGQNAPQFEPSSFLAQTSPHLVFQKWQAYDRFIKEYDHNGNPLEAFDTKLSRLSYLQNMAKLCNAVYQEKYPVWFADYQDCVQKLGAHTFDYRTLWRMIVGWSTNPALETGITLHHLYGFPYIPGSAIKGLVHHVAEVELMEKSQSIKSLRNTSPIIEEAQQIIQLIAEAELVKELFGSIQLEQGKHEVDGQEIKFGPKGLAEILKDFNNRTKNIEEWKVINERIERLLAKHTGGMVRFYDAVPEPGQHDLLQTDIVNPHYPEYYDDNSNTRVPSDDQSPRPIYFLAVRPEAQFHFYYQIRMPRDNESDEEAVRRKAVLDEYGCSDAEIISQKVTKWIRVALGFYGVGAKTSSGYGYFKVPEVNAAIANAKNAKGSQKALPDEQEPNAIENPASAESKTEDLNRGYNKDRWLEIANSPYIQSVQRKQQILHGPGLEEPICRVLRNGLVLEINYKFNDVFCTVQVTLFGIESIQQANYVWNHHIKPELER